MNSLNGHISSNLDVACIRNGDITVDSDFLISEMPKLLKT